jgi:hypothetical protein
MRFRYDFGTPYGFDFMARTAVGDSVDEEPEQG